MNSDILPQQGNITIQNYGNLLSYLMEFIEKFPHLSGNEKKEKVISLILTGDLW